MLGEFLGVHIQEQIGLGTDKEIVFKDVLVGDRRHYKRFGLAFRSGLPFKIRN